MSVNALIERTVADHAERIALIEIGRQVRSSVYDLTASRAVLPVPRARRFAVDTRRAASGERLARPGREELAALADRLRRAKVEADQLAHGQAILDGMADRMAALFASQFAA